MESSRRSIDRSKEPGSKKPRLIEEVERNRYLHGGVVDRDQPILPRVSSGVDAETGSQLSRLKRNQRERNAERDDSVRGSYQQQQHQELVLQYKTALAELTINSKPIITNLTIIAGENLHAAKGIAATVSANILEVPREQKLPSLYLLDSIVKNIGRDYIKYFAARLPEVFCKAYRQVDSPIHHAMRHLFGTWKGVFPTASLQMIEKELGFAPTIVVSSSETTASRPDSQTQRPPHSIHVNPKYLEARQQLQQSSKEKGTICGSPGTMVNSDDAERPDRKDSISGGRPWADLPVKLHNIQRPQREALIEPVVEKNSGARHDGFEYGSDLSRRHQDLGISRASERVAERGLDKPRYGAGNDIAGPIVGRKNGFDIHHGVPNYRSPKSALVLSQPESTKCVANKSSKGSSGNWKDSEEEEFIWDDINSRVTENGASDTSRRDDWTPDDAEKFELEDHIRQIPNEHVGSRVNCGTSTESLSIPQRVKIVSGHQKSSLWPLQESHLVDGLNCRSTASIVSGHAEGSNTLLNGLSTSINLPSSRMGPQQHMGPSVSGISTFGSLTNTVSGPVGTLGKQRHQPLGPASPSGKSSMLPMRQRPYSPSPIHPQNLTEQDHQSVPHPGLKPPQLAEQLNRVPHLQNIQDSSFMPQSDIQSGNLQNPESNRPQHPQNLPISSSSIPFPQVRHHTVFSRQLQSDLTQLSGQTHELLHQASVFGTSQTKGSSTAGHLNNSSVDIQGHSGTSSLLAAITESGLISVKPVTNSLPDLSFQDAGPLNSNVQPPLPSGPPPAPSSTSKDAPASLLCPPSHGNASASRTHPQTTAVCSPMPLGPPSPSNKLSVVGNPVSSLLSSLVAKGLISASTMESPAPTSSQVDMRLQNHSPGFSTSSPMVVTSSQVPSTIPLSSSRSDPPFSKSVLDSNTRFSHGCSTTETNLVGIEFKQEIIRQSHPSVISGLFDDLPYCCKICGLRLKIQDLLEKHLEWHASKKQSSLSKMSRRWYVNLGDWIAGHVELPSAHTYTAPMEDSEKSEQMVPADESQCVCALCGELFEDFYSHERDEWMFKGAVYMTISDGESMGGITDKSSAQGPIVHFNCISQN